MPNSPEQDPRVYFAAERTFLAWIRTGLGLMGVGFAVSRFGLFLREFSATHHTPIQTSTTTHPHALRPEEHALMHLLEQQLAQAAA